MLRRLLLSAAPVSSRRRSAKTLSPAGATAARASGAGRLPYLSPSPLSPLVVVPRRGLRSRGGRGGAAGAGGSKTTAFPAPSSLRPDVQMEDKKEVSEEEEEGKEALPSASRNRTSKVKLSHAREQWEQQQREAASSFSSSLDEDEEEDEEDEEDEGWMEELDECIEDEEEVEMNMLVRSLPVERGREAGMVRNLPDRLPQGSGDEGVGFVLGEGGRGEEEARKKAALWELVDDRGVQEEEDRWRRRVGLTRTSRESVFEAMRQRLQQDEKTAAPSKRQLRLSTAIWTVVSDLFYKDGICPAKKRDGSPLVDITEVNMSMDLRHAVIWWTPAVLHHDPAPPPPSSTSSSLPPSSSSSSRPSLPSWDAALHLRKALVREVQASLDKGTKKIRFECCRRLKLKRMPALEFRVDQLVEGARKVSPLLAGLEEGGGEGGRPGARAGKQGLRMR
ncbi:Hypothetical protein NocV09_02600960 [Nannochloropsis oceanica]